MSTPAQLLPKTKSGRLVSDAAPALPRSKSSGRSETEDSLPGYAKQTTASSSSRKSMEMSFASSPSKGKAKGAAGLMPSLAAQVDMLDAARKQHEAGNLSAGIVPAAYTAWSNRKAPMGPRSETALDAAVSSGTIGSVPSMASSSRASIPETPARTSSSCEVPDNANSAPPTHPLAPPTPNQHSADADDPHRSLRMDRGHSLKSQASATSMKDLETAMLAATQSLALDSDEEGSSEPEDSVDEHDPDHANTSDDDMVKSGSDSEQDTMAAPKVIPAIRTMSALAPAMRPLLSPGPDSPQQQQQLLAMRKSLGGEKSVVFATDIDPPAPGTLLSSPSRPGSAKVTFPTSPSGKLPSSGAPLIPTLTSQKARSQRLSQVLLFPKDSDESNPDVPLSQDSRLRTMSCSGDLPAASLVLGAPRSSTDVSAFDPAAARDRFCSTPGTDDQATHAGGPPAHKQNIPSSPLSGGLGQSKTASAGYHTDPPQETPSSPATPTTNTSVPKSPAPPAAVPGAPSKAAIPSARSARLASSLATLSVASPTVSSPALAGALTSPQPPSIALAAALTSPQPPSIARSPKSCDSLRVQLPTGGPTPDRSAPTSPSQLPVNVLLVPVPPLQPAPPRTPGPKPDSALSTTPPNMQSLLSPTADNEDVPVRAVGDGSAGDPDTPTAPRAGRTQRKSVVLLPIGESGTLTVSGKVRRASLLMAGLEVQREVGISIDNRLSMQQVSKLEKHASALGLTGVDSSDDIGARPRSVSGAQPSRSGPKPSTKPTAPPKPAAALAGLECVRL